MTHVSFKTIPLFVMRTLTFNLGYQHIYYVRFGRFIPALQTITHSFCDYKLSDSYRKENLCLTCMND